MRSFRERVSDCLRDSINAQCMGGSAVLILVLVRGQIYGRDADSAKTFVQKEVIPRGLRKEETAYADSLFLILYKSLF